MENYETQVISEDQTIDFAEKISKFLQPQDVIFLSGNLGAGKTFFSRALIRHLKSSPDLTVPSPTFTLVQTYETAKFPLWHFDLYRIRSPEELYEIGWEEALYDGVSLIEWAEKMEDLAPADRLEINFATSKDNTNHRIISLQPCGSWKDRMAEMESELKA